VRIIKYKSLYPLIPKEYNFGKRRDTYLKAMNMMTERGASVLVETGVARHGLAYSKSDGASTIVFGIYAKNNGAKLYSVDINPDNIATCQKTIDKMNLSSYVELNTADSIKYLNAFTQKVDFLYLDSYDYNRNKPEIIKDSQAHHLEEIKAVEKKLHENSIILIDDCKLPGGGKGKSAIKYLKSKGWKIVINKYQVLLKK
jgi:predicted O-methyltransferase YrrM